MADNWADKTQFGCQTCQWWAKKERAHLPQADHVDALVVGRCRRHAPSLGGWPVVFPTDWCGDHKLGNPPR